MSAAKYLDRAIEKSWEREDPHAKIKEWHRNVDRILEEIASDDVDFQLESEIATAWDNFQQGITVLPDGRSYGEVSDVEKDALLEAMYQRKPGVFVASDDTDSLTILSTTGGDIELRNSEVEDMDWDMDAGMSFKAALQAVFQRRREADEMAFTLAPPKEVSASL